MRHFDRNVVELTALRGAHATAHIAQDEEAVRFHLNKHVLRYRKWRSKADAPRGEVFERGLDHASAFASQDLQRCRLLCWRARLRAAFHSLLIVAGKRNVNLAEVKSRPDDQTHRARQGDFQPVIPHKRPDSGGSYRRGRLGDGGLRRYRRRNPAAQRGR